MYSSHLSKHCNATRTHTKHTHIYTYTHIHTDTQSINAVPWAQVFTSLKYMEVANRERKAGAKPVCQGGGGWVRKRKTNTAFHHETKVLNKAQLAKKKSLREEWEQAIAIFPSVWYDVTKQLTLCWSTTRAHTCSWKRWSRTCQGKHKTASSP